MSSDFYSKIKKNTAATALNVAPPISNLTKTQTVRGQDLYLPAHQMPNVNPNGVLTNTWFFNAVGNYNTALANGGIQQIKIDRGTGSGKTSGKVWLRINITNGSGAAVQFIPAPFWFSNIQFQTAGGDIIQQFDPWGLWMSIIGCASSDEWASLSDLVNASNSYESNVVLNSGATQDVWIPLQGNVFSCGDVPTRVIQGDSMCYVNFAQPATTVLQGTAVGVNINNLALVFEMQQLDNSLIGALDKEYRDFHHDYMYPYMRVMNWTQTWNASSQYTLQLSGITGGVVFAMFVMRASMAGEDTYHGFPITDFQFQNEQGVGISGAQLIPESYNRWGQLTRWFLGTWMQERRFYGWNFAAKDSSPVEFLLTGRVNGQYGFSGNEQLVIDTAPAGTSEVQTLSVGAAVTTSAPCWFQFVSPFGTFLSATFNPSTISNASLVTIIEQITGFEGTVAITGGPLSSTGSITVTFGGNYSNRPMWNAGYQLTIQGTVNATGLTFTPTTTTQGVRGITNGGTYTLTLVAFTTSILGISSKAEGGEGRLRVQNS